MKSRKMKHCSIKKYYSSDRAFERTFSILFLSGGAVVVSKLYLNERTRLKWYLFSFARESVKRSAPMNGWGRCHPDVGRCENIIRNADGVEYRSADRRRPIFTRKMQAIP